MLWFWISAYFPSTHLQHIQHITSRGYIFAFHELVARSIMPFTCRTEYQLYYVRNCQLSISFPFTTVWQWLSYSLTIVFSRPFKENGNIHFIFVLGLNASWIVLPMGLADRPLLIVRRNGSKNEHWSAGCQMYHWGLLQNLSNSLPRKRWKLVDCFTEMYWLAKPFYRRFIIRMSLGPPGELVSTEMQP